MKIVIIGGGASGMAAAIKAKQTNNNAQVIVLEKMDRVGKKLLATGNGRCNYSNLNTSPRDYYGQQPHFVNYALKEFTVDYTVNFFNNMGVFPREESQGRLYPFSGQASAVLDALRCEMERLGVQVLTNALVKGVDIKKGGFKINLSDRVINCNKLIIACGGCASPKLGSDGSGFTLLKALGHNITALSPALVQMKTKPEQIKGLSGIRVPCNATLIYKDRVIANEYGEVQFTDYGLSGIAVFQLSLAYKKGVIVSLDFMEEYPLKNVFDILWARRTCLEHLTMENYFNGLLNKRIGNIIARSCGIEKLSYKIADLDKDTVWRIAGCIKDMRFDIIGLKGFENAQATAGGVDTREFNSETMESRIINGLYCCGEIFDVVGSCGGYNLQWAWSSGMLAGKNAADLKENIYDKNK